MTDPPVTRGTRCPECDHVAQAVVPKGSELVEDEEAAEGKVWVTCRECEGSFLAYYREK